MLKIHNSTELALKKSKKNYNINNLQLRQTIYILNIKDSFYFNFIWYKKTKKFVLTSHYL